MSRLARAASGAFVLKVTYAGLSFAAAVLLARILGTDGYGVYAFATACVALLAPISVLGFDRLLTREVAKLSDKSGWAGVRGLLRRSNQIVASAAIVVALLAALIGGLVLDEEFKDTFWLALIIVPLWSLSLLRQAAMQGLDRIVLGLVPETAVRPGLLLVLVGVVYAAKGGSLDSADAMTLSVIAAASAFLVGTHLLRSRLGATLDDSVPEYRTREWLRSAVPLTLLGVITIVDTQTGTVLLGAIEGPGPAGVYAAAARTSEVIAFILVAVNAPLAPMISRLYSRGRMAELQDTVTRTAKATLALTLPIALVVMVFPTTVLKLFGGGFTAGGTALTILAAGHLFNATMGSVGILLVMTGHERDVVLGVGVAAALNVALTAALVPVLGVEGAALARGASLVVWNVTLAVFTYRRLKIHTTAFGSWRPPRVRQQPG